MSSENLGNEPYNVFTDEEIAAFLESRNKPKKSRDVCACGHSMNFHRELGGRQTCRPAKIFCRCANPRPVLTAEDLRMFTYATDGYGEKHALGKGIMASGLKGAGTKWVAETPVCDQCGTVTPYLKAVSINLNDLEHPRAVKESGHVDKLLCGECLVKWTTLGA